MNFLARKRLLNAAGIAVSMAALHSIPVGAATVVWDLAFFIDDTQVGSGEFSYDDSAPLEETFIGGGGSKVEITASANWYRLESFSANINELLWTLKDSSVAAFSPSWSPSKTGNFEGSEPYSIVSNEQGTIEASPEWGFGSYFGGFPSMGMLSSSLVGGETYFYSMDSEGSGVAGTWTATPRNSEAVPEGPTIFGSLMAIGILAYFKKALGK
jgi:hypothetical protein